MKNEENLQVPSDINILDVCSSLVHRSHLFNRVTSSRTRVKIADFFVSQ